jgi:hypothetical protein
MVAVFVLEAEKGLVGWITNTEWFVTDDFMNSDVFSHLGLCGEHEGVEALAVVLMCSKEAILENPRDEEKDGDGANRLVSTRTPDLDTEEEAVTVTVLERTVLPENMDVGETVLEDLKLELCERVEKS